MKKLFLALLTISLVQWGESIDANACQSSPCVHGSCFSGPAGYLCVCDHGYTGIHCDSSIDISVSGGPTCYSCSNHTTKDSCTDIQHCPAGQDCEAKVAALTQGILGRKR
ncbi:FAT4-like protein, partial [Mya arenaria]